MTGFGFNTITVDGAASGTTCRILIDGQEREKRAVDNNGKAKCEFNKQDERP